MKLLEFCEAVYKKGNRPTRNGFEASRNNIILKVGIVYNNLANDFKDADIRLPSPAALLDYEINDLGSFNGKSLPDLVRIIFDVVTDQNLNAELWEDRLSLKSEISHTLLVLIYGPLVHLGQLEAGPIHGNDYDSVRAALLVDLEKSRNPLDF